LRIFQDSTTHAKLQVKAHEGPITAMDIYEDESLTYLVTVGKDLMANFWKIEPEGNSCELFFQIQASTRALQSTALSPSGRTCVIGGWDNKIHLYNIKLENLKNIKRNQIETKKIARKLSENLDNDSIQPIATINSHSQCISGLAFSSENVLYSSSLDHSLHKWDIGTSLSPNCTQTLTTKRAITCLSCPASEGRLVAFGSTDKTLRIWDTREKARNDNASIAMFSSHEGWLSTLSWFPNKDYILASGSYAGRIKIWDNRVGLPISTINAAHEGKILSISWFRSNIIASGGTDCILNLNSVF